MNSIQIKTMAAACGMALVVSSGAQADNWNIYLTVDNQFDVYFGTPMTTNFYAGGGNNWPTQYNYTATGRAPTDYLYVATASDHSVAQGFVGIFQNTTTSQSIVTGSSVWEVFPAGAFAATNPYYPNPWPASLMPSQAQVDAAIAYATTNNLWVAPATAAGYDLDPGTPTSPYAYVWGYGFPNIPQNAQWIWHDSGNVPSSSFASPYQGGNHDEFLVFRVPGIVPEPATVALLALGGLGLRRRVRQPATPRR